MINEQSKELIEKLDTFFEKKGMDTDEIILLLSDMKYLYQMCRLQGKSISDIYDDLEDINTDDIEDYDDGDLLFDDPEEPEPEPVEEVQRPTATQNLKKQLGKPLSIKNQQVNIKQPDIDKGNY